MLLQFSVSNFRAFRGLQTLNLMANNSDKSLLSNVISPDLPGLKNKKWVKGIALYGANASGKSTLIEALKALANFIQNSAKNTDPKEPIYQIEPFALDPDAAEEPTAFAIVFVSAGVRYEYRVAATRERIWHESLRSFPKGSERLWYIRDWSPEEKTYRFNPESPAGLPRNRDIEKRTLPNMLYLSKAIAENRTELEPVFRWFAKQLRFLDLSARASLSKEFTVKLLKSGNPSEVESIIKILKHADLGVSGATVIEISPDPNDFERLRKHLGDEGFRKFIGGRIIEHEPKLFHDASNDKSMPLPWERESMGTHRLFSLVGPWLDILKNGYTVCIDELETSMHPHMVMELLKIFYSEKYNPNHAQILFTTHNPLLLDTAALMRRDQIWLTDKDHEGQAHLYPLTDYKPRKGESLVRGYMAGRYGGVPYIPNGLLDSDENINFQTTSAKVHNE